MLAERVVHQGAAARRRHAVVIGAGFGGLAAAIRLDALGYRVSVFDRLDAPGGRARPFHDGGFTFDAGPTIVTAPHLFAELWQLCGRRIEDDVEIRPLAHWYRIRFHDGEHLDCVADPDAMLAEIARIAPDDVDGYRRFMRAADEAYALGFEALGDRPFDSPLDMLRVLPAMIRMGSHRSLHAMVARLVRDERLRFALSFHPLFVGGNPFRVTAIYSLIGSLERRHGVHHVIGGTGRLASGLSRLLVERGHRVRQSIEVDRIEVEAGRATGVRLADGESVAADVVVSNADPAWTYGRLLRHAPRRHWSDRRIERSRFSMGVFVWYFGTARRWPAVSHHTILVGPRYRALLDDIFERKVLAKDFSLYLHRPTANDPSLAPEGCDTFYVLSPVPHLRASIDWAQAAEPYRQAIERHLEATLLPGLSGTVLSSRVVTPCHFRDELLSWHGAAFGMEPVLTQSAWFRPHNRSQDVDRLFLVGAGTHPGAGLPGVLSSARILDRVVPHADSLA
ncbi:MAG: phytoene desaturase family protein [Lautropia sp.]